MPKTSYENIKTRLLEGFDADYYHSLYRLQRYAYGEDWSISDVGVKAGTYPDFPTNNVVVREIGKSQRMLNVATIALARMCYSDPEPEFPDIDKYHAEVRKQFLVERSQRLEWQEHNASVLLDADQLGIGSAKIVLRTNRQTDRQYVDIQHVPALQVLWDRHKWHPSEARWVCFVDYMPVEEARERWGAKNVQQYETKLYEVGQSTPIKVVRIFEYYDLGWDNKGIPTVAFIPGDLTNAALEIGESDFPEMLPWVHASGYLMPGIRRPMGRIAMTVAVNESLNDLDRRLQQKVKESGTLTVLDLKQLNPQDVKQAMSGRGAGNIRRDKPIQGQPAIERIEQAPLDQTLLAVLQHMEKAFTESSGMTEMDRGTPDQSKTLGQTELLAQRSASRGTWQTKQTLLYYRRLYKTALYAAGIGDRDPVTLSIFGRPFEINSTKRGRRASSIDNWLKQESSIAIGDDALAVSDSKSEQAQKLSQLLAILPLVQGGLVDPTWYTEEALRAIGVQDPSEAMPKHAQNPGQPQPGQPMPPQPGMPPQTPNNGTPGGVMPISAPPQQAAFTGQLRGNM